MKKKINTQLLTVAILSIFITMLLLSLVYYDSFQKQVFEELRTYSRMLQSVKVTGQDIIQVYDPQVDNIRVTLVAPDGAVEYDSNANAGEMNNHSDRPEIADALQDGEGSSIRMSGTLSRSTYYYAVLLEDGNVLRVAKEANSIWSMFLSAAPSIVLIAIALIGACMVVSHFFAKSLISPIQQMAVDINHMGEVRSYDELQPFIDTINQQHDDIVKNAKLRQEFTANVSHELKTPLTVISGYSELIENGMADEKDTVRFATEINRNATRLLTLINDILRLSELDVGDMDYPMENVDLYELAAQCVSMLQINAENHNVTLYLHGENNMIYANKSMIEEVLYNLCDNAIRYNEPGGRVDITVEKCDRSVMLKVVDDGIGISKENKQRIFERFYRVDKSRSKQTGGTGLGLAIVKHIVGHHGAQMELESELGAGTTIRILFAPKQNLEES